METNIKNLNSGSYEEIQYILTCALRIKILMELYESDKNLKEINKDLHKKESNILRYLKELEEKDIIKKTDNKYTLLSKGYLIIRNTKNFLKNMQTINSNLEFWNNHSIDNFPLQFIRNINLWNNSKIIKSDYVDYEKVLHKYIDLISKSTNIKIILPIISPYHLEAILNALTNNKGTLELITSTDIIDYIYESEFSKQFTKLKKQNIIKIYINNKNNMFLTCTTNFALLSLFYEDGSYDDSTMLLCKNKNNIKQINTLFNNYKNKFKQI